MDAQLNEVLLFHGVGNDAAVEPIVSGGLVANLGGMLGAGVYFAESAGKSDQYVRRVPHAAGRLGARRRVAAPRKYREFVIYNGAPRYPELIVQYRRQ